ncbi:MAG: Hint domain-containing protein [Rhodobacter sp.]|nr:Hint domain-containing protein [Rhodobacter sp.]
MASGLVAGTMVATPHGWRPVEAIVTGDLVLTFDRGLQPVRAITRGVNWSGDLPCPTSLWPLTVPAGALGNQDPMTLLPEQCVMVESDAGDVLFDDPFTLLSAAELHGFRGILRGMPDAELEVIQLQFDDDEVVFANAGALVFCPSLRVINMDALMAVRPDAMRYLPLSAVEAELLLDCIEDEDEIPMNTPVAPAAQPMRASRI